MRSVERNVNAGGYIGDRQAQVACQQVACPQRNNTERDIFASAPGFLNGGGDRAHGSVPADREQGVDAPVDQIASGLGAGFVDTGGTREGRFPAVGDHGTFQNINYRVGARLAGVIHNTDVPLLSDGQGTPDSEGRNDALRMLANTPSNRREGRCRGGCTNKVPKKGHIFRVPGTAVLGSPTLTKSAGFRESPKYLSGKGNAALFPGYAAARNSRYISLR